MTDLELANKRVLIREDFNVPMKAGRIVDDERIKRALPGIQAAISQNARVILLSHLGRPEAGHYDPKFSLEPVAAVLAELLKQPVMFIKDWLDGVSVSPGQVVLCENVRFNRGEENNDSELAKRMAKLCDIFVMDAFATAHRVQASTVGVAEYAPIACAGPLLSAEIQALSQALDNPKLPLVAIVGGSKVSTKIALLGHLIEKVDQLIVGGGIANTFLAAQGYPIGQSLYEADWIEKTKRLLTEAASKGVTIVIPQDVRVATEFSSQAKATIKGVDEVNDNELILDVGPKTAGTYQQLLANAATIVWNGPIGVFEFPAFSQGTQALANAIADSAAYSIAGGGDTLAVLSEFNVADKMSYVSTGGGAFLSYLQGETLPAIKILQQRANTYDTA